MSTTVRIGSDEVTFPQLKIMDWAKEHCQSYYAADMEDYSDISSWSKEFDTYYTFSFRDEKDALMFILAWGGEIW